MDSADDGLYGNCLLHAAQTQHHDGTLGLLEYASNNLVLVACHSVYKGGGVIAPISDSAWCLHGFQSGEPHALIAHIRKGIEIATQDPNSLLVFSGGPTRLEAGPISEAQSYWQVAEYFNWWGRGELRIRTTTEEFALDSLQNVLFGLCRFYECAGRYPHALAVVSWGFKAERFGLHRVALRFPATRFSFVGVSNPVDIGAAMQGERKAIETYQVDPYASGDELSSKRRARNPFSRTPPYALTCPDVSDLLNHKGPELFAGPVPWDHL